MKHQTRAFTIGFLSCLSAAACSGGAAPQPAMTFNQCAEAYIAGKAAEWENAKHRQQWRTGINQLPLQLFEMRLFLVEQPKRELP